MNKEEFLKTSFDNLTNSENREAVDFTRQVVYFTDLTPDDLNWLFSTMCVKDEEGKWRSLSYLNYKILFEADKIKLIPNHPLYDDITKKVIPLKDEYLVKSDFEWEQRTVSEFIRFPKYTGYEKVLNKEVEDLNFLNIVD